MKKYLNLTVILVGIILVLCCCACRRADVHEEPAAPATRL